MASGLVRIELLDKENYDTWKIQMEALLIKNDEWGYINGENPKPKNTPENEIALKSWIKNDKKAKSDIILSINPSVLKQVTKCTTSKELWDKLESIYQSKGPAKKATLLKQLTLHRMDESTEIRDHLHKFFDIIDKLNAMDVEINQDLLTIMLLYSLPPNFENFRCAIESRDELPSLDALRIKIIEEYDARKNDTREVIANAMVARSYSKNKNRRFFKDANTNEFRENKFWFKCHICHRKGHKARNCPENIIEVEKANNVENVNFYAAHENPSEEIAFKSTSVINQEDWCLDSGCTTHLCKNIENFNEITDTNRGKLNLANNAFTEITARGNVLLTSELDGKTLNINVNNVSHVPDLRTNLLSVGKMTDQGMTVIFEKDKASIINKNGQTILIAGRTNGLYFLRGTINKEIKGGCNFIEENPNNTVMWHRKMGHLNIKDLQDSYRKENIRGMTLEKLSNDFNCEICIKGKMTRNTFPTRTEKSSELLEIVYSDVWGPARVASNGGARYFITFIDDFSGWCVIQLLKTKNEAFDAFKNYKVFVENQTGKKIKYLQSDNGREYVNNIFDKFLIENGIGRRLTVTHTPEQNGVAERRNRTLVEMARCMLIDSGLPQSFWGEAINTANYTRNRCPSKSLGGKTAFELWTGKIPNVHYFQIFGCEVYTLNRDPTKGKFESRSKKGIFMGYSEQSKAYRVWIPTEKKIDITRDIKLIAKTKSIIIKETENLKSKLVEFPIDEVVENNTDDWFDDVNNENRKENIHKIVENALENENESRKIQLRSREVITRSRGRPKKCQMINDVDEMKTIEEFGGVAEISLHEAINGPDTDAWLHAMAEEMKAIIKKDTWIFAECPENNPVIGSRIILRNKYNADGTLQKRKARIVAKGFTQHPGIDFDETYAPVARIGSIRLIMSIAAQYNMKIQQFDVTTAYLNGLLEEEIYMKIPEYSEEILNKIIATETCNDIKKKAEELLNELKK